MTTRLATLGLAVALLAPVGLVAAGTWNASLSRATPLESTMMTVPHLLALRAHAGSDRVADAVQLALEAGASEARLAGVAVPAAPVLAAMPPAAALRELAARHGAVPSPQALEGLAALDAMPGPAQQALGRLVVAFLAMDSAADAGLAGLRLAPQDLPADLSVPQAWARAGVDFAPALAARASLLDAVAALSAAMGQSPPDPLPERVEVPGVFVIDFTDTDNTYAADLSLVVDKGGDDLYLNNAGGSHGRGAAALVDYTGNDRYVSEGRSGVNGGAFIGLGLLFDGHGDDVYAAEDDGTNGGAYLGAGMLVDASGSDTYRVFGWGANGGGYPGGLGALVDYAGDDTYTGMYEAVNGGGALGGSGLLFDGGGADAYSATWGGVNGGAEGGHGLLIDAGGDDAYTASGGGVNGGGATGVGLLWDDGGRDAYLDFEGGSGFDVTVLPKGTGAQVDQ